MKFSLFLAPLFLFAASTTAFAQDPTPAKEAPPDPPLMNNAPADCQWTITYASKTPEKEAVTAEEIGLRKMRLQYSPVVLSKNVMKSAGQVVILTNYEASIKSEGWVIGGYLYQLPMHAGEGVHVSSRGQGDFPDIDWVTAENFRGTVDLKGTKAHLYEMGTPDASPSPAPRPETNAANAAKQSHQRVYIDAKSRLPLIVDIGNKVLTYKYAGPPTTFPTPSDRIKQIMRETAQPKKH